MTDGDTPRDVFVLSIEGEMTIYRAKELKETLLGLLARPEGSCHIELSRVTELDSAGVQLLVLVKHLADKSRRDLQLIGHSAAVLDVLTLLNLKTYLDAGAAAGLLSSGIEVMS